MATRWLTLRTRTCSCCRDLTIDVGISEEADSELGGLTEEAARVARRDSLMSKALEEPIVKTVMDRFRASVVRIEESNEP